MSVCGTAQGRAVREKTECLESSRRLALRASNRQRQFMRDRKESVRWVRHMGALGYQKHLAFKSCARELSAEPDCF